MDGASNRATRGILTGAALLAIVQGAIHASMFVLASKRALASGTPVVVAMTERRGTAATYWEMYYGYGLLAALTAALVAALIGIAATYAHSERRLARRIVLLALAAVAGHFVIITRYFFLLPAFFDLVVALLLGIALWLMSPARERPVAS